MLDPYRYVLKQESWTSEVMVGDFRSVMQAVIAGFLNGKPRWAETETGMFIYGIDRLGIAHKTGTNSPDFSES
jgi:hypothetical protein